LAERLKQATGLPTIAVGLITEPAQAEAVLAEGRADAVALARGLLYNPRWPWHAAAALGASVDAPHQYWRSSRVNIRSCFAIGTSARAERDATAGLSWTTAMRGCPWMR
jgi:2,4-dienoyl-CoA reductase-like NADH-dependent reductase (Old Yellow Enzyme family)